MYPDQPVSAGISRLIRHAISLYQPVSAMQSAVISHAISLYQPVG
jgi:hypothetical protein